MDLEIDILESSDYGSPPSLPDSPPQVQPQRLPYTGLHLPRMNSNPPPPRLMIGPRSTAEAAADGEVIDLTDDSPPPEPIGQHNSRPRSPRHLGLQRSRIEIGNDYMSDLRMSPIRQQRSPLSPSGRRRGGGGTEVRYVSEQAREAVRYRATQIRRSETADRMIAERARRVRTASIQRDNSAFPNRPENAEVIDVDALPDRPPPPPPQARQLPPIGPRDNGRRRGPGPGEVEITFARARFSQPRGHRAQRLDYNQNHQHNSPHDQLPPLFGRFDQNDDFMRMGEDEEDLDDDNMDDEGGAGWAGPVGQMFQAVLGRARLGFGGYNFGGGGGGGGAGAGGVGGVGFQPPMGLDYGMRAGIFGQVSQSPPPVNLQAANSPHDKPIPPVRKGFTRNPTSDDCVVCPVCDDELGDSEEDLKRAIWVGKCGHCFCGTCAKEIQKPLPRGKAAPKELKAAKICPVEGCKTALGTKRAMWEIYV